MIASQSPTAGWSTITSHLDQDNTTYLVFPSADVLDTFTDILHDLVAAGDDPGAVNVVLDRQTWRDFSSGSFTAPATITELVTKDVLTIRRTDADTYQMTNMLVADTFADTLIYVNDALHVVSGDGGDIPEDVVDAAEQIFETAEQFSLRTPAYDTFIDGLEDEFGAGFRDTFEEVVAAADDTGSRPETALLLTAATQNELLYDVGAFSEEVNLASKATISRLKQQLEDRGYITTEKVPQPVGRPRQRLTLTDQYKYADPADIIEDVADVNLL